MNPGPANVKLTFFHAMTFAVSAASLVLADAEGSVWPAGFTPFVAVATYLLVDRLQWFRLPVFVANLLGIAAFAAMLYEFWGGELLTKLLSGAHLIVYMTWVVLLLQKGIRQFWWLATLCLLQISVASVLTNSPQFGAALVAMLFVMLWMLSVFTLYRSQVRLDRSQVSIEDSLNVSESRRNRGLASGLTIRNGLQIDTDEHWIGWRFRFVVVFAFVSSLFVGLIAFAVFPRVWVPGSALASISQFRSGLIHQTGFTDSVQLGEIGTIMQSEGRVLQFEVTRMADGEPVSPESFATAMNMDEILFRGNTLGQYQSGRWTDAADRDSAFGDNHYRSHFNTRAGDAHYRIRITQDAPIGTFAFAPLPVTNAINRDGSGDIEQRRLTFSLTHKLKEERTRAQQLRYEVWCPKADDAAGAHFPRQPRVFPQSFNELLNSRAFRHMLRSAAIEADNAGLWCITPDLKQTLPQLFETANEICADGTSRASEAECFRRIESYLTVSGNFQYSLKATIEDPNIDPIEDFLINRKVGHCEYFASAGALMLQAVGIPARVVNGYKGSEVNSVTGFTEVKQKHAHTWLEAYVDERWRTMDPTPTAAREELVSQTNRLDWWRDLKLAFSDGWYGMVQRMSLQQQEALVRPLLKDAKQKLAQIRQQGVWESLKTFFRELVLKPEKWFSLKGWLATFVILFIPAMIFRSRLGSWLITVRDRIKDRLKPQVRHQRHVVRFYDHFKTLCRKHGLILPESQTALENANQAVCHFADVLNTAADRALPIRLAVAFNSVRFGRTQLTDDDMELIRDDVARLKELFSAREAK